MHCMYAVYVSNCLSWINGQLACHYHKMNLHKTPLLLIILFARLVVLFDAFSSNLTSKLQA